MSVVATNGKGRGKVCLEHTRDVLTSQLSVRERGRGNVRQSSTVEVVRVFDHGGVRARW